MAEPNQKQPQDMYEKPPPYSPMGGPEYPNAYGPAGAYVPAGAYNPPPQNMPAPQPHIFASQPAMGYQMGQNVTVTSYGPDVPVYGASTTNTQIIVVGGCPACRIGVLEDEYTCCGICMGVLFFPLGLLCCLAMKQRRCPNCGAIFG